MVWQQYRRVDAGSVSIEELDMDISVVNSEASGLEFDVTVWNLTDATWGNIDEGDPCRITLGWDDGPRKNVVFGTIEKKRKSPDKNDIAFRLKGKDESETTLRYAFSKSYEGKTYSEIAGSIAGEIGLTIGDVERTDVRPDRIWTISKDRPARHWLNQLVSMTEEATDEQWEWFVDAGKLYFVRKDGRKEDAVKLSFDNTLVSIGEAEGEPEAEQPGLEFTAMCEPRIRKGGVVSVDAGDYSGAYKVTEYRFESSTVAGDHLTHGQLAPLGASYETTPAGARGFVGRGSVGVRGRDGI